MSQLSIFDIEVKEVKTTSDLISYLRHQGYKKVEVGPMGSFWFEKNFEEKDIRKSKSVIFRSDQDLVYMETLTTKDHEHIKTICKQVSRSEENIKWIYEKLRS